MVESLRATPEHPFYVKDLGWARAGSLAIGNSIVTRAGPGLSVRNVTTLQNPASFTVYNFTVEEDHSYFVGTSTGGVWVHNSCDPRELAATRRINNAIRDHLEPHDIPAAVGDMMGSYIPRASGGYWNHVDELANTLRGLRNNLAILSNSTDPAAVTARLRALIAIRAIERAVMGAGL